MKQLQTLEKRLQDKYGRLFYKLYVTPFARNYPETCEIYMVVMTAQCLSNMAFNVSAPCPKEAEHWQALENQFSNMIEAYLKG